MEYYRLVKALDEQDAIFAQQHSKYASLVESRSPAVAPALPDARALDSSALAASFTAESTASAPATMGTTSAPTGSGAAGSGSRVSLGDLVGSVSQLASGAIRTTAAIPENSNDPRMFKLPLLTSPWDAVEATRAEGVKMFVAKLPDFSCDIDRGAGFNCLTLRGEYYQLRGYDNIWFAVDISDTDAIGTRVLCHFNVREDPLRKDASGTGTMRRRLVQGYKISATSNWETEVIQFKDQADYPLRPNSPFWLRIVLSHQGFFSYLDGKFIQFTPYPLGVPPKEFSSLFVSLPISGGAGERVTWKVHSMFWGMAPRGLGSTEIEIADKKLRISKTPIMSWSPDEVRLVGDLTGVLPSEVQASFSHYGVAAVRQDTDGTYIVTLSDAREMTNVLREMHGRPAVKGREMKLARVLVHSVGSRALTASMSGVAFAPFKPTTPMG